MKWASWVNVILGAWLIISPWTMGYRTGASTAEDVILGAAVIIVALVSMAAMSTAGAWVNVILGIWIIIAPWVLGYAHARTGGPINEVITGVLVVVFALLRLASGQRLVTAGASPRERS
jgi:hypothetical protein